MEHIHKLDLKTSLSKKKKTSLSSLIKLLYTTCLTDILSLIFKATVKYKYNYPHFLRHTFLSDCYQFESKVFEKWGPKKVTFIDRNNEQWQILGTVLDISCYLTFPHENSAI